MRTAEDKNLYKKLSKQYLSDNPKCEICGKPSKDLHHKAGRTGFLLNHVPMFAALCRICHNKIHFGASLGYGPKWAEKIGMKINLSTMQYNELNPRK